MLKSAVKAVRAREVVEVEKKVKKHEEIKNNSFVEVPEEYHCETSWAELGAQSRLKLLDCKDF